MQAVVAEGDTIDAAIDTALAMLGVTRDRVEIEIISNATRGILGFGGRKARVRATLRRPITEDSEVRQAAPPPPPPPAPQEIPRSVPSTPAPAPPATVAPPAPAAPTAAVPDQKPAPEPGKMPTERTRPELATEPATPTIVAEHPTPTAIAIDDAAMAHAARVLQEIVARIGIEAQVTAKGEDDRILLQMTGDTSGVLIGRRGQMLDALEYIVNRIVSRDEGASAHIVIDSENYRERRRAALEDLARRMAQQAKRKRKPITLNPMSPRDRRIVHLVLQGDRSLTTRSSGTGFYRKLVIIPEGAAGRGTREAKHELPDDA